MTFQMKDKWNIPVTVVADDFIDHYMAAANGEYVKVYLYILRHRGEALSQEMIADALNHTESDVRRALTYWEKAGVLSREESLPQPEADMAPEPGTGGFTVPVSASGLSGESVMTLGGGRRAAADGGVERETAGVSGYGIAGGFASRSAAGGFTEHGAADGFAGHGAAGGFTEHGAADGAAGHGAAGGFTEHGAAAGVSGHAARVPAERAGAIPAAPTQPNPVNTRAAAPAQESAAAREPGPVYSAEQVNRLSGDEEFAQLLYIAQKYMNKVFTPRDCQVFAYLYDGLKFSPELLEYLVEYCVQNGHVSIRYMETVAINWHKQGFKTPEEAKEYTEAFNSDAFSVMKAFGLGDRRPGTSEQQTIRRWFKDYGFDREIVLMACNRTIASIHNPSFQYADKILSDWKQAGVRTKADVEALDEKRVKIKSQGGGAAEQGQPKYGQSQDSGRRKSNNQFHNFKQRDTDYDALVLKQLKERVGQQQ